MYVRMYTSYAIKRVRNARIVNMQTIKQEHAKLDDSEVGLRCKLLHTDVRSLLDEVL